MASFLEVNLLARRRSVVDEANVLPLDGYANIIHCPCQSSIFGRILTGIDGELNLAFDPFVRDAGRIVDFSNRAYEVCYPGMPILFPSRCINWNIHDQRGKGWKFYDDFAHEQSNFPGRGFVCDSQMCDQMERPKFRLLENGNGG
jgi:hypothetical protein